ncbi:unnamed protein product [Durusdinium trenchii]|uniref:Uncharacterized protein n=1 Tax=Durusdinium trenchii TaxID=1381693 RepID=A0ABP0QSN5_9DINO
MSLPFKTKAEERAKLFLAIKDGKDAGEPAPKRACIVYEKFEAPADGLPVCEDWLTTFESMLLGGVDLAREQLDGTMACSIDSWECGPHSVDLVKGWTRASAVLVILIAASELDLTDPAAIEKLRPLFPVLDKCWTVPVHFTFNMDEALRSFRNIQLSFRGSERQAPNSLQLSLRFARVMEVRAEEERHLPDWTTDQRLSEVVAEFNATPGLGAKHRIEDDRYKAIFNLVSGTCEAPQNDMKKCFKFVSECLSGLSSHGYCLDLLAYQESRAVIRNHLDRHKWQQSAFNTDQFKSLRWLVGACPKSGQCPAELRRCLTVTERSQTLHFQLVVKTFGDATRCLRPSARARARLSPEKFEGLADFACVYAAIWDEARTMTSWNPEKDAAMEKAFFQKDYFADVTARLSTWKPQHLSIWCDLVEAPASPAKLSTPADLADIEEQAHAARFREIRAKLSQDVLTMSQLNAKEAELKRRKHVISVMHEKAQLDIGKELCETYMEKRSRIAMATRKDGPEACLDAIIRQAASDHQVDPRDVDVILFFDCTKLGVLTQSEINMAGDFTEKVLGKNPTRSVLVLIPPPLVGSESGGSLRQDIRTE